VTNTVYVMIRDGLGNQLFQAALGVALERRFGFKVRYVIRPTPDEFGRKLMLRSFPALPLDLAPWEEVSGLPVIDGKDMTSERLAELLMSGGSTLLTGWWQDESYFYGEHQAIREAFALVPDARLAGVGDGLRAEGTIGVHVRRGEYGQFGLVKSAYYWNAIGNIRAERGARRAVFFTDEPNFCRAVFSEVPNMAMAEGNLANPLADFYLLSRCAHFVIANSSFSWWAAWLGRGEDSIIHAPSPWNLMVSFDPTPFDWRRTPDALIYP
jgi:hypothetical protein